MTRKDGDLVSAAGAGDGGAFGELVRRHHARILRLCRSMLGSDAEGDDAAQAAFLKAYEGLAGFDGEAEFSTWVHRISANLCMDLLRKRTRAKETSLEGLREIHGEAWEAWLKTPSEAPDDGAGRDLIEAVLGRLSPEYRLVLTLREGECLSYEEICQTTGWSLDSVKARLKRARREAAEIARHLEAPEDV